MIKGRTDIKGAVAEVAGACHALKARRAANYLARLYSNRLSAVGLEVSQFSTLCIVADGRARTVQAIADYVGAERSTLARNLKVLVRRGLLSESPREGRLEYELTPDGEKTLSVAIPLWREAQATAEAAMQPA